MDPFQPPNRQIRYVVDYSKRASILKLTVDAGRGVVVTAPVNFKRGLVDAFVREKSDWIAERLENLAIKVGCPLPRRFVDGEPFLFLGRRYSLNLVDGQAGPAVWLAVGRINVSWDKNGDRIQMVRDKLYRWYKDQAGQVIGARVDYHARMTGLRPSTVRIKKQKYRWGSCSARGSLNFNWKLVMAPETVIDYVVVHELCHLFKMDHSPQFWRLVARLCPDYKQKKQWLKENGAALGF